MAIFFFFLKSRTQKLHHPKSLTNRPPHCPDAPLHCIAAARTHTVVVRALHWHALPHFTATAWTRTATHQSATLTSSHCRHTLHPLSHPQCVPHHHRRWSQSSHYTLCRLRPAHLQNAHTTLALGRCCRPCGTLALGRCCRPCETLALERRCRPCETLALGCHCHDCETLAFITSTKIS